MPASAIHPTRRAAHRTGERATHGATRRTARTLASRITAWFSVAGAVTAMTFAAAAPTAAMPLGLPRSPVLPARPVRPALIGVTHTQVDADNWRAPAAVARAESILRTSTNVQAQAIFGWGAMNPEPSPGRYDWSSLDRRVALMTRTTSTPVITLCCAPDWMKGGRPGQTDWTKLEVAPTRRHIADFARLSVAVAKRYPQVRYYQVWNELKGFGDPKRNNWNMAAYLRLYNAVYDALKRYDPTLKVGGPYVRMDTWHAPTAGGFPSAVRGAWGIVDRRSLDAVRYWLAHKHGADFLAVDGASHTRDHPVVSDPLAALAFFSAVDKWLRARTTLPIWWSEVYVGLPKRVSYASPQGSTVVAAALATLAASGAHAALLWDPERYPGSHSPGLWTSTVSATGGDPTPLAGMMRSLLTVLRHGRPVITDGAGHWRATAGGVSTVLPLYGVR